MSHADRSLHSAALKHGKMHACSAALLMNSKQRRPTPAWVTPAMGVVGGGLLLS